MAVFSIIKEDLQKLKMIPFKNEKAIQVLTEKNINQIFALEFVNQNLRLEI